MIISASSTTCSRLNRHTKGLTYWWWTQFWARFLQSKSYIYTELVQNQYFSMYRSHDMLAHWLVWTMDQIERGREEEEDVIEERRRRWWQKRTSQGIRGGGAPEIEQELAIVEATQQGSGDSGWLCWKRCLKERIWGEKGWERERERRACKK